MKIMMKVADSRELGSTISDGGLPCILGMGS